MSIDIKPETERIVRDAMRQGHFQSVDDLIVSSVHAWRERILYGNIEEDDKGSSSRATSVNKAQEFVAWAEGHPYTAPLSDEAISRASLNPDRW